MSDKRETIVVDESQVCFCSGAFPHYDLKAETQAEQQVQPGQERIPALDAECPSCRTLEPEDLIRLIKENQKL